MKKWTSMEDFAKKPGYKPLTKTQHKAIEKYIKHGEVKNDLTDLIMTEIREAFKEIWNNYLKELELEREIESRR